ncbi:MAG: thioredoxin family protein [Candidatus Izemoplasmatales bacterium]
MEIKVMGSGCKNCKKLLRNVEEAAKELQVKAEIKYITDMMEIADSGLMKTPGLIIDKKIVSAGKVLTKEEAMKIISKY